MVEPRFADDDDLPRTLRRERDAREREAREREMPVSPGDEGYHHASGEPYHSDPYGFEYGPAGGSGEATVTRLRIPFLHLVLFFMKAAVAAIPAIILLGVLLWGMGQALKAFYPELRHFEIVVKTPR